LAGQAMDTRRRQVGQARGAPQLAFHRVGGAVPVHGSVLGGLGRRTDRGVPVRRTPLGYGAAGRGGAHLGRRRIHGSHPGLGDHRRHHWQGRRSATRPHGDDRVLRLQHGRLLRPLAEDGQGGAPRAAHLPRQLVQEGRERQVHLARLRREHACPGMDRWPLPWLGEGVGDAARHHPGVRAPELARPGEVHARALRGNRARGRRCLEGRGRIARRVARRSLLHTKLAA
jgi:hypothetical protein